MTMGLVGAGAQSPHGPIQQNDFGRQGVNIAIVGLEGRLGRVQHEAESDRRRDEEDIGGLADDLERAFRQFPDGQADIADSAGVSGADQAQERRDGDEKFGQSDPPFA